ncbi:Protease Do-like 10 [Raphanus sativus]|nr:Protease Do-like 10 [Raphanus sativus]
MFIGSVRILILRCSSTSSQSVNTTFSRRFSSVLAAENAKDSVIDLALNSVVKVFCSSSKSNALQPWQKNLPRRCSGSGFVISNNKILTNAHVVADHTFVQVRKHGSPTKFKAEVESVEVHLRGEAKFYSFWKDLKPLDFGDVPFLNETVFVVGYPRGGDNICITKGVVSRIEVGRYSYSKTSLMTIQTDAAINPGNSGGPAFMDNKVVGVAFQGNKDTGCIIPTPVVKHFISGAEENDKFPGFCSLGILCQHMQNARMRNYFKMTPKMTGVLIKRINPLSSSYGILKKDDVLLSIDGVSIGNDETVVFRKTESIDFNHLVSMKKPCETTTLKVLRDGKTHEFNINITPVEPLHPVSQFDKLPSYYIFAGLVFFPSTQPVTIPKKAGEQIVLLSQVLEDETTVGYTFLNNSRVKKVNGVQVENLKHLRQLIDKCCTEDLRIDLGNDNTIIIGYKSGKRATPKILKRYGIPATMSNDLQSL